MKIIINYLTNIRKKKIDYVYILKNYILLILILLVLINFAFNTNSIYLLAEKEFSIERGKNLYFYFTYPIVIMGYVFFFFTIFDIAINIIYGFKILINNDNIRIKFIKIICFICLSLLVGFFIFMYFFLLGLALVCEILKINCL